MSQTDNYEFSKSCMSQAPNKYTPYSKKEWNYLNDINSGVYTNASLSLVQFDLTSIFNSSRFTDTADLFLVLPIVFQAAFSSGTATIAPGTVLPASIISKLTNNANLIHQCDIVANGKVLEQVQPYINKYVEFKMLSEMSVTDLKTIGPSLGFSDNVDNPFSVQWNNVTSATASYSGNGVCNNRFATAKASMGTQYTTSLNPSYQNVNLVNSAISQRVSQTVDATQTAVNILSPNIYGTSGTAGAFLMTPTQLANEFKPYYTVLNNFMVFYDACVIRLKDVYDSMANCGLTKRFDATLRVYVNTGTINSSVTSPNTTTVGYYSSLSSSTFTNTCPLTINWLPDTNANGGIPLTTTNIVAGCYIARPPTTNIAGINMASSGASHPMSSCRCYYSSIELKKSEEIRYIEENRNKKVVYRSVISNMYTAIPSGGSWSQLVQSGITNPCGLLIMPFVDGTVASTGGFGPGGSPFDTNVCHPLSITNLQVSVGGVNQLANTLFYTYENFLEQVNVFESLTSSDLGIGVGLISKDFWEINRTYYVNIGRGQPADMLTPRNINVSFTNNSNVSIQVLIFVIYLDECEIDVETGIIKK